MLELPKVYAATFLFLVGLAAIGIVVHHLLLGLPIPVEVGNILTSGAGLALIVLGYAHGLKIPPPEEKT